jgi:hypothetical protein
MDFKREQEVKVCSTGIFNKQERLISCESPTTFSNTFNLMRDQKNIFIQFSMTVKTMHPLSHFIPTFFFPDNEV